VNSQLNERTCTLDWALHPKANLTLITLNKARTFLEVNCIINSTQRSYNINLINDKVRTYQADIICTNKSLMTKITNRKRQIIFHTKSQSTAEQ